MKQKTIKRLARLCLCLMLVSLFVPVLSVHAHAEEKEKAGWVLQAVLANTNEERYYSYNNEYFQRAFTYKEYGYLEMHEVEYTGFTLDLTAQSSQMPKSFYPGDTVTLNYDFDIQANIVKNGHSTLNISSMVWRFSMPEGFDPKKYNETRDSLTNCEYLMDNIHTDDSSSVSGITAGVVDSDSGNEIKQTASKFIYTIPEGKPGNLLIIQIEYYHFGLLFPMVVEEYLYTWEGSASQEIIGAAGSGSGETGEKIESGIIKPGSDDGSSGGDSGWSGGDDGDDGDGGIVGTIAKVGGAAAAGVGAKVIKDVIGKSGKSGGKGKKKKKRGEEPEDEPRDEPQEEQKEEQKEEKKSYEMRVFKEFGDTIYVGKTVTLSARIVEISASGVERTVPELTNQITISSSNYLQVGGTFPSGQYQSARVTAPECDEAPPSTALVTFRLMAPGGSFTQNMRFNIKQADPMVVWLDPPVNISSASIEIIAGDNATYRLRFFYYDVSEEPEKIVFDQHDNYEITAEPADTMYTYWILVKNRTAPMDNKIIYERYPYESVTFTAIFKDGMELSKSFSISCFPEGLSVVGKTKNGRIPVKAYESSDYKGGFNKPYSTSMLYYTCARRIENGAEVFRAHNEDIIYGDLKGDGGEKDNNVAMKYEYEVDEYGFYPMQTLHEPTPGETYLMKIDVMWKDDPGDVITLPLTFNLKPKSPMEEWQEEFQKLVKNVIYFVPEPEDRLPHIERLKKLTPENSSKKELKLMGDAIRDAYIEYWESDRDRKMDLDGSLEWWGDVLGWVKFAGDCAFSYLIYYYATSSGCVSAAPYIDAIASAGKDIFASIGGRYIGAWWSGEELYLDGFVKECNEVAKSALDDCIFEMIPDNPKAFFKSPSIKKVGVVIGAYMLVNFAMNLAKIRYDMDDPETQEKLGEMSYEERQEETSWGNSIYEALIASFKDMSLRMLTTIVGSKVEKYLKDPKVQKKIGNFVTNTLDTWWKAEKKVRITSINAQRKLSGPAKKLYEIKALRTEALEKMAYGLRDIQSFSNRSKSFNTWKDKVVKTIESLPEAMVGKDLMDNVKLFESIKLLRNPPKTAIQGGMIMDKIISKGAGIVYDLYTGQVIDCFGMMWDLNNMANANNAAAEMKERVQAKKAEMSAKAAADQLRAMIEQVTAEIESAETPEIAEKAVGRFLEFFGKIDMPEEGSGAEEEEDDYEFDSTPEFKTGSDGFMYVVTKLRKPGTEKRYRIEYNLNKIFTDGLDSEMFVEFFKLFFGGKLPDFPEKKVPIPANPPLPSELN